MFVHAYMCKAFNNLGAEIHVKLCDQRQNVAPVSLCAAVVWLHWMFRTRTQHRQYTVTMLLRRLYVVKASGHVQGQALTMQR